jgi:alkylation response protein AidB-like acyl-CoA dehydrogenase
MDFDWTTADLALHQELAGIMAAPGDLATLRTALAARSYLGIALNRDRAEINLTAAMEIAAHQWPEWFLPLEMSTRVFGRALARWGDTAIHKTMLDPLRNGQTAGAMALCEGAQNMNPEDLKTTGTADHGYVRVTGIKTHVLNPEQADSFAVLGRLDKRPALFLVPRHAQGVTVGAVAPTMAGPRVRLGTVTLAECRIPADHAIIPADDDNPLELVRLWENQVLCAAALADMGRAFDLAKHFADTHPNGGKPIIAYQAVAFKLAEMFTLRQTAQLLAYHAGWRADAADRNAMLLMTCAKVFCTEAAERITSEAMQVLGVHGCAPDHPLMQAFGRSKFGSICGSSSEVARNAIGDTLMKYLK